MKQKVIALLLIAIMTLTAFGTVAVATSQKVEAATPTSPAPISISYKPGAKYVFTVNQFKKYDSTFYNFEGEGKTSLHGEFAVGGLASSLISAKYAEKYVYSSSFVGVTAQLNGAPPLSPEWQAISAQPCKVTMHVSYYLVTKGDSVAKVKALNQIGMPFWSTAAFGNDERMKEMGYAPVMHGSKTVTEQLPVGLVFRWDPSTFGIQVDTGTYPYSTDPNYVQPGGSATASAVLDYITIEFPQTLG